MECERLGARGEGCREHGGGVDTQLAPGTLLPGTHRPTSPPWAEKLLIDQEELEKGGGGGWRARRGSKHWVGGPHPHPRRPLPGSGLLGP